MDVSTPQALACDQEFLSSLRNVMRAWTAERAGEHAELLLERIEEHAVRQLTKCKIGQQGQWLPALKPVTTGYVSLTVILHNLNIQVRPRLHRIVACSVYKVDYTSELECDHFLHLGKTDCNPAHLKLVTVAENNANRPGHGANGVCKRGHFVHGGNARKPNGFRCILCQRAAQRVLEGRSPDIDSAIQHFVDLKKDYAIAAFTSPQ